MIKHRAFLVVLWLVALIRFCTAGIGYAQTNEYAHVFNSWQSFDGVVDEMVDDRANVTYLTIIPQGHEQRVLVSIQPQTAYQYGDRVWVQGVIAEPQPFNGFNYPGYLASENIFGVMQKAQVIVLAHHQNNRAKEIILNIRNVIIGKIEQHIRSPENQVVLGMLLGARKNIPRTWRDAFSLTGTSHILSVSGYNMTLIIVNLTQVLKTVFRPKQRFVIISIMVGVFTVMTGASSAVLRAAMMGYVLLSSRVLGRSYRPFASLTYAITSMVIINPLIVLYDVGFQLSTLATIGILYVYPWLDSVSAQVMPYQRVRDLILVTVAAISTTLPLTLYAFHTFHVLTVVINMLVVPIVPFIMTCGVLSIIPGIGYGFGFLAALATQYIAAVVVWFGGQEGLIMHTTINGWYVGVYYVVFALAVYISWLRVSKPYGRIRSTHDYK